MIPLLVFLASVALTEATSCSYHHFNNVLRHQDNDFLIYGVTQDCQMFFLRPSQLHLLTTIRVESRHSYCYPNLVQLHLKSHDTLLLLLKQANNRICTLEVHIPTPSMLFGDHLFRYSLLNSLRYAACSHATQNTVMLEPDLSFMDSIYSNVLYLADGLSSGTKWNLLQFKLSEKGTLQFLTNFSIASVDNESTKQASEYIVGIDAQRNVIYRRAKLSSRLQYQCAYDLLFKPESAKNEVVETPGRSFATYLEAITAEHDLLFFAESDKTRDPQITRLQVLNKTNPEEVYCLAATNFVFDFGVVRAETLERMREKPLPAFGEARPSIPTTHKPRGKTTKFTTTKPKSTYIHNNEIREEEPTVQALTSEDVSSPSEDIETLSNDLDEVSTTTEAPVDFDQDESEEEDEIEEMVKVLRNDKGVGELRLAENHDNSTKNDSIAADPAAVTSSAVFLHANIATSILLLFLFK